MRDLSLNTALGLPVNGGGVFLQADWPAPPRVRTLISTRQGGISQGVFASLNVGAHVGDDAAAVAHNRALVEQQAGRALAYLNQTHSTTVVAADAALAALEKGEPLNADASVGSDGSAACAVMTADCLPVLFCADDGNVVAAAHAGWRGLLAGVLEETVAAMAVPANTLLAYLGPAIGPRAFEVGDEVRSAFVAADATMAAAFQPALAGKWLADLYLLARLRLARQGVTRVYGGAFCSFSDADRFFSYRRDGQTGRMASLIWLAPS